MHMLQPSRAGRDYTLFGAPAAAGRGPASAGFRLAYSRPSGAPSPAGEDAVYWDPCA